MILNEERGFYLVTEASKDFFLRSLFTSETFDAFCTSM